MNVLASKQIYSGENNFIGYLYDYYKVKLLHIMLPKVGAYVKGYDGQTKWMYFLSKNNY